MPTYKSAKESYAEEDMLEPDSIAFPLTSEIILAQIEHPDLIGGLGTYFDDKNDYFTRHMIHFDTRGYKRRYWK
ncbi:MAG: hypothetical protein EBX50_20225 [Chitinophagia bacterium]|nr:hypothetical protein [Chitinophagia bacterium]